MNNQKQVNASIPVGIPSTGASPESGIDLQKLAGKLYEPTIADDDDIRYTQVLQIEIDGCHPVFHGNHTPGICEVLTLVVKGLRQGIQLFEYPQEIIYGGFVVGQVDLIEKHPEPSPTLLQSESRGGRE